MSFTHIQTANNTVTTGTSLTVSITGAFQNNLLVIGIRGVNLTSLSITDNASTPNTYAPALGTTTPGAVTNIYQYYAVQVTGGATSVTVTWPVSTSVRVTVDEFSGNALSNGAVFDNASSGSGSAGTTGSVTSFSPAATGELIVASLGSNLALGTVTAGTGYVLGSSTNANASEYNLSGSVSETAPISWTGTTDWAEVAAAYIAAPPPALPPGLKTFEQAVNRAGSY